MQPKGVILSGSPASVPASGSPRAPQAIFDSGLPILGICYGQQVMSQQLGGQVDPGGADGARDGEFGRAFLTVTDPCVLFDGLDRKSAVSGQSVSVRVDIVGRRSLKKKNTKNNKNN